MSKYINAFRVFFIGVILGSSTNYFLVPDGSHASGAAIFIVGISIIIALKILFDPDFMQEDDESNEEKHEKAA